MKKLMKRFLAIILCVTCLMMTVSTPAVAISSSKSKKTGWKSGDVISYTKSITGSGRTRYYYIKAKDVYVSERVVLDKRVQDVTQWNSTSTLKSLDYSKSTTIKASGDLDIVKKLGLKVSISIGSTKTAGGSHKANPKSGKYARLSIKCDYWEVTYKHYTYDRNGKQTGCTMKTVLVPIPNTAVYYVRYTN